MIGGGFYIRGGLNLRLKLNFVSGGWFKFMSEEEFCYRDGLRMIFFFITGAF